MTESSSVPVPGRYQHMFWFALLLATAVMLAGASIAVGAYQGAGDPATVVRSYFAAVAAGDAAGALGYGDLPAGRRDLLTADVLAAQNAVAPISDLIVLRVQHSGANLATVDIGYTLDFASGPTIVVDTVALSRHGHDWRLASSAVAERVSPGNGSTLATFAGATVPTGDYAMFPGAVPITYHTPNLEADSSSRAVRFAGTGSMQVDAQVTAAGRKAIAPAVNAALAACLAGKGAPQALCPVPDGRQLLLSSGGPGGSAQGAERGQRCLERLTRLRGLALAAQPRAVGQVKSRREPRGGVGGVLPGLRETPFRGVVGGEDGTRQRHGPEHAGRRGRAHELLDVTDDG